MKEIKPTNETGNNPETEQEEKCPSLQFCCDEKVGIKPKIQTHKTQKEMKEIKPTNETGNNPETEQEKTDGG